MAVTALAPEDEAAWDAFVERAPGSTPFHLLAWKRVVERSFGHRAHYLLARRGGHVVGVLPLVETKSFLFGHALVSVPFAIGGGVLAEDAEDDTAASALLAAARALADSLGVDYLELRSERPRFPDLPTKDLYVTFRADLTEGEEALLRRMERKRRQMMSYVARAGYELRLAGEEELPLFYRLFSLSMRRHGTPVYPRRFLAAILDEYRGQSHLAFVHHRGRPVAAALSLLFAGVLLPFYAGAADGGRPRGADDFLYLALMRWGRLSGFHTFDFGRSKRGTGAWKFKSRWGMEEVPLGYQVHLVRAKRVPNLTPANPRFDLPIRLWRRLPLPLTEALGPLIVKRLP